MSQPFRPQPIPLGTGVRQDLGSLAVERPESLQVLRNAVFTKAGALRGRPSPVSADGAVQVHNGTGVAASGDLSAALGVVRASVTAGVIPVQVPSDDGQESPLLHYQGASFLRVGSKWSYLGGPWSTRQTRSPVLRAKQVNQLTTPTLGPGPVGTSIVGVRVNRGGDLSTPFLNDDGAVEEISQVDLSSMDATSENNVAAVGEAVFWLTAGGLVKGAVHPTGPAGTLVAVAAGGAATTGYQGIAAVQSGSTYYVAWRSSTAGRVTLAQVSSTGTVSGTTNVNGLGTVIGIALAVNAAGTRLCLSWEDSATTSLKTKILNTSFVDQALDVTMSVTQGGIEPNHSAGTSAGDEAGIGWSDQFGNYQLKYRSFTAASITATKVQFLRAVTASPVGTQAGWRAAWGPIQLAGRDVVGAVRWEVQDPTTTPGLLINVGQWLALDVTDSGAVRNPTVVAAGQARALAPFAASNAALSGTNKLSFVIPEGLTFAVAGVTSVGYTRITLEAQGAAVAHAHGHALTTGARANNFDGISHRAMGFTEDFPLVLVDNSALPAGTLANGSYSIQATWEAVNGQGQVVRSGASNIWTKTVAGAPKGINVTVTIPQLHDYLQQDNDVRVRLWATVVNPSAGAPLYFVDSASAGAAWVGGSGTVTIGFVNPVDTAGEQLYTGGGVFDDQAPPAGDRGVAYAGERLWVADQRRVYASKILRPNLAPSWNTQGLHTVELPSSLGQIQGLIGLDENLLVIGSTGLARVYGPGLDDLGAGNGWTFEVVHPFGVGRTGPRSAARVPGGVLVVTHEGETWLVQGFQPTPISKPVRDSQTVRGVRDVAVLSPRQVTDGVYGTSQTNISAVVSTSSSQNEMLVVDMEYGHWVTWDVQVVNLGNEGAPNNQPNPPDFIAGVNGILWTQATQSRGIVASYTGDPGADYGGSTMTLRTGILRPNEGPARGWGSVQGLTVHATEPSAPYNLKVVVRGDSAQRELLNKTATVTAYAGTNWPASSAPEYRSTTQRASFVTVELQATPPIVEWSSIDLWVSSGSEPAPARSRS